jgi:sterol desaturase/sphingolipid hydroxylase (fatty acid hydroxylase superfamily)
MQRTLLLALWFGCLLLGEERRRLRTPVDNKGARLIANSTVGAISALVLSLTEMPATRLASKLAERKRIGLLQRQPMPAWLEACLSFILLDYSIYVWHVMLHKLPLLWRFHIAHHTDRDLDVTTTLRFHFGELLFSMFWRCGTIMLLGIRPSNLKIWESFLMAEISFHHSNLRLPMRFERALNRFIVTPRMHGIHHSLIESETNSNWSSGLTIWDLLHGTLKLNVPQERITIGVPAYRTTSEVSLSSTLNLPFRKQKPTWELVRGGDTVVPH